MRLQAQGDAETPSMDGSEAAGLLRYEQVFRDFLRQRQLDACDEDSESEQSVVTDEEPFSEVCHSRAPRLVVEEYHGAAEIQNNPGVEKESFRSTLNEDQEHLKYRRENPWWPCKTPAEFRLISLIHRMGISEVEIDELLNSEFVSVACQFSHRHHRANYS
jgi:hypothetical protein